MQTNIFEYHGLYFFDKDGARQQADADLKKVMRVGAKYDWSAQPICSLAVRGIIWRGNFSADGLIFSVDVVEHTVG
jgi:hypothetical protein